MTDKRTYLVLPNKGEIELDYLLESVEWARKDKYELKKWFARKALIDKNGGSSRLYTGQSFDNQYIELKEDGWTHDHCEICSTTLSNLDESTIENEGYFNGQCWICKSCHELFIEAIDLKESIDRLKKIEK